MVNIALRNVKQHVLLQSSSVSCSYRSGPAMDLWLVSLWEIIYTQAVNLTSKKKKKVCKKNKYIIRCLGWCMGGEAEWIQIPSTHCGGYWGAEAGACCVRLLASASAFFLFPPDLLPPPQSSSLHQLLSFPQAGNESCCLWCEGELGGGNNGAERKCQSQRTRVRACFCLFSVYACVCLPSYGLLKIPFDIRAVPLWTPAEELSSVPCSLVLPLHLFPLLSSISACRVISRSFFLSIDLSLSTFVSFAFTFTPRCLALARVTVRNQQCVSKENIRQQVTPSPLSPPSLFHRLTGDRARSGSGCC